jgi:hypothetical protein
MYRDRFGLRLDIGDTVLFPYNDKFIVGKVHEFSVLRVQIDTGDSRGKCVRLLNNVIKFNTMQDLLKADYPELLI